ncbi:DUF2207 domain-containing protein [Patescibacteria group bacterium]|nr:DUF2207 domain-containing protein [Patescibacteria group bacterium]
MKYLLACVFVFFAIAPFGATAADWTVENFYSEILVQENGVLNVEEEITVDFYREKHGIFRYIPIVYKNDLDSRMKLDFNVTSITLDGENVPYEISWYGSAKMIKIGNPGATINGKHIYKISYSVDRAIIFGSDYDELYWNVTGEDWEVALESVGAGVILPSSAEILSAHCYTGSTGSSVSDCVKATDDNVAAFVAEYDYLTIAVGFPKGIVKKPSFWQRSLWFAEDNWAMFFPILLIIFTIWQWWTKGKDPRMETIVAEYDVPDRMTPVYAGLLAKGMIPQSMFAAMIVHMAVEGYIKIINEGGKIRKKILLQKLKEDSGLDYAHTKLFNALFPDETKKRSLQDLKYALDSSDISTIRNELQKKLKEDGIFVVNSKNRRTLFIVISVVMMFVAVYWGSFLELLLAQPIL